MYHPIEELEFDSNGMPVLDLDENVHDQEARLEIRLDTDNASGFLLLEKAERILAGGDPDTAIELLQEATTRTPELVPAWERLGESLLGQDDDAAREALLKALRAVRSLHLLHIP